METQQIAADSFARRCSVISLARRCARAYKKYEAADALFSAAMAERYGDTIEIPDEIVEEVRYGGCANAPITLKKIDEIMKANGYPPNPKIDGRGTL